MAALERRGQAKLLSLSILQESRIFDPATPPPLPLTHILYLIPKLVFTVCCGHDIIELGADAD